MDNNQKLSRIHSLLKIKKSEENVWNLKIKQLNEEIYGKKINPVLIMYLNFTTSNSEKLEKAIEKAGGQFISKKYQFTRSDYDLGLQILEQENYDISVFFQIFKAKPFDKNVDKTYLYEFLEEVEQLINDLEFARKHNYLSSNLEEIYLNKYLKVVYDERIEIIRKPIESAYLKIHGIWEINTKDEDDKYLNENSYLLTHCTRSHTSCWPIISEGLKLSKSRKGRCGVGIYFSNDVSKCLQYTTFVNLDQKTNFSLVFFAQVYLGKIKQITRDDSSLTKSEDYDTIHALGRISPNMDVDIWHSNGTKSKIFIDKPVETGIETTFYNNEYVIYDEKRCRLRYVVLVSNNYNSSFG